MKPVHKLAVFLLVSCGMLLTFIFLLRGAHFPVLEPSGLIALKERTLIIQTTLLMLTVVIPIYALVLFFAWYYRAGNTTATYVPNWEHAKMDELIWWAIPFEIILILGALTWSSTHDLDPRKALDTPGAPLKIQVVALQWKWLFIYPEQQVASVNDVRFPVSRPIEFDITADAPMNSFWLPDLGGQIYAMTGMVTKLHIVADHAGIFPGLSANYSGSGFEQMKFMAHATSQADFDAWVQKLRRATPTLDISSYKQLAEPGVAQTAYYRTVDSELFDNIVIRFMSPVDGAMPAM